MKQKTLKRLWGWGRYPIAEGRVALHEDLLRSSGCATLARGLGRSYGDAALPAKPTDCVAGTELADRILSFDAQTGRIRTEAGCPLWRINRLFLPRGWFVPVTPGTKYVTIGGMVAADVHGKMHHVEGTFGQHVHGIRIRVASGEVIECSPETHADLFYATIGGMGLTGHILEVEFHLRPIPSPWILQEIEVHGSLSSLLPALREAGKVWPFTVAWADFLNSPPLFGRGAIMKGRWAHPYEAPPYPPHEPVSLSVPDVFPSWFLQAQMVRWFNRVYFWRATRSLGRKVVSPDPFFYPLDALQNWNRVYGQRGFTQYQCVLPTEDGFARHEEFASLIRELNAPVFLAVIKDCGKEGQGILSFPKPGISYALDMPITDVTQRIVSRLNEFVIQAGGRIYLAKDALTRREEFVRMEPRLMRFWEIKKKWDPEGRLRSALSVRLFGDFA